VAPFSFVTLLQARTFHLRLCKQGKEVCALMSMQWSAQYETGQEDIDQHHQELFRRMNDMYTACKEGRGKQEVLSLLDFLSSYAVWHFGREEAYTQLHKDPRCVENKQQHAQFAETVVDLRKRIDTEGASLTVVMQANELIRKWLTNHILGTDCRCFREHILKTGNPCQGCK